MILISVAYPEPPPGEDYSHCEVITVPNDSISLEEMLRRFTVGEPLDVEHEGSYVPDLSEADDYSDPVLKGVDLEKLGRADLVDKAEFVDKLKKSRATYEMEEKARQEAAQKAAKEREDEETYERIRKSKLAAKPKKKESEEDSESA